MEPNTEKLLEVIKTLISIMESQKVIDKTAKDQLMSEVDKIGKIK